MSAARPRAASRCRCRAARSARRARRAAARRAVDAVLVVDVRAIRRRVRHLDAAAAAERAVHVPRVGLRAASVQPSSASSAGEADRRLHVGKPLGVLRRAAGERSDFLPEEHVGVGVDERRDPQTGKQRDREHPRLDEDALQPADQQPVLARASRSATAARRRCARTFAASAASLHERQAAAVAVERLQRLKAEEARRRRTCRPGGPCRSRRARARSPRCTTRLWRAAMSRIASMSHGRP